MDKLIVIDGLDGAGKATQTKLLIDFYKSKGIKVGMFDFPNYNSLTGKVVKAMLHGEYGSDAESQNPYSTSMLYSIDRACSLQTEEYKKIMEENDIIISNRYTISNMLYQGVKFYKNPSGLYEFCEWLQETEYGYFKIPRPDFTIFLYASPEVSINNLHKRDGNNQDLYETKEYLTKVADTALAISDFYHIPYIKVMDENNVQYGIDYVQTKLREQIMMQFHQLFGMDMPA